MRTTQFLTTGLLTVCTIALASCGQNAHLIGAGGNGGNPSTQNVPTPPPPVQPEQPVVAVSQTYVGDDTTNGEYNLPLQLQNGTGGAISSEDTVALTFDSPDGKTTYFTGSFAPGANLKTANPTQTGPGAQVWSKIQTAIVSGALVDGAILVFDKKIWAEDETAESFYYRLFNQGDTKIVPVSQRHAAVPLRISVTVKTATGNMTSSSVILPVRYRYAFDEDSLGRPLLGRGGVVVMNADPRVTTRVVAGLESASSPTLLTPDAACRNDFGLNYDFQFVDTHTNFKSVEVTGTRLKGTWTKPTETYSGKALVEAAGEVLGGGGAIFTPLAGYGGLCNYKVYGIVLANKFSTLEADGLKMQFNNGVELMDATFGLTVMEAF